MEILLLVLTIGLPLLKFLLFPARTMGRGGNWTLIGAVMIVGLMMALWFGAQAFIDVSADTSGTQIAGSAPPPPQLPDFDHLAKML